jgi:hypothetical protein
MGIPPLLVIALFGGLVFIVLGFVAALQKSDKTEDESPKRSDERMKKLFETTPTSLPVGVLDPTSARTPYFTITTRIG